jgi:hypothetical protein
VGSGQLMLYKMEVNFIYYNETVKEDLRKPNSECWVPDLSSKKDRRILKKIKA